MLMTSGVKYGLGRTLPHLAGVILGFGLMIAIVGLGLDILFERFPQILPVMRVAGAVYMIWLALKIALAKPISEVEAGGRPIGFLAAAGFQWVNPKAWVMALSALATYAGVVDGYTSSLPLPLGQRNATSCGSFLAVWRLHYDRRPVFDQSKTLLIRQSFK